MISRNDSLMAKAAVDPMEWEISSVMSSAKQCPNESAQFRLTDGHNTPRPFLKAVRLSEAPLGISTV